MVAKISVGSSLFGVLAYNQQKIDDGEGHVLCSNLTQWVFVGAVSDNFDERIEQKIFHAEIVVDSEKISSETKVYQPIPIMNSFIVDGVDTMKSQIQDNYRSIKEDITRIVADELARIEADPELKKLLPKK